MVKKEDLSDFDDVSENLNILSEEAAEVIKLVCKINRFGLKSWHPRNPEELNYELLEEEIGDFLAMVDILVDNNIGITLEGIDKARLNKFKKLRRFYKIPKAN